MRLTKDTLISELVHSDDELAHYKYVKRERNGDRWRYWYKSDDKEEYPIGQNYTTPSESKTSDKAVKKEEQENSDLERKIAKIGRYIEAAKVWIKDIMGTVAVDQLTGKDKPITWQTAKEFVDSKYADGDQELLLTDKYRDKKR